MIALGSVEYPRPSRRGPLYRLGFTIVEIVVGSAILSVLITIGFFMYSRSSTMYTKGIWRVNSTNELRNGLRQIQRMLANTSYPTRTTAQVVGEVQTDAWKLRFVTAGATEATSGSYRVLTFRTSDVGGQELISAWNCQPETDGNITPPSDPRAERWTLLVSNSASSGAVPTNRNLLLRRETGSYRLSPAGDQMPTGATPQTTSSEPDKVLVRDVDTVVIKIPVSDTNERGLVSVSISCKDNIDGRLTHTDAIVVEKNVQIFRQTS